VIAIDPLPEEKAREVVHQIVDGVQHLHSLNIVHLDLKVSWIVGGRGWRGDGERGGGGGMVRGGGGGRGCVGGWGGWGWREGPDGDEGRGWVAMEGSG
jgi:hypothetical protein